MRTPLKGHSHVGVPTNVVEKRIRKIPFKNMKGQCGACIHKRQISRCRKLKGQKPEGYFKNFAIWPADTVLPCESWFFCNEKKWLRGCQACWEYVPKKVGLRKPDTEADKERIRKNEEAKKDMIRKTLRTNPYAGR